jgi:hypothetical protein
MQKYDMRTLVCGATMVEFNRLLDSRIMQLKKLGRAVLTRSNLPKQAGKINSEEASDASDEMIGGNPS